MKKAIWLLLLSLLLACAPATTNTEPADTEATETEEDTAVANSEDAENSEEPTAQADASSESDDVPATADNFLEGAANLENFSPAGTVEEAAVVREQDWRKGATTPEVVIIEYGDFQ